MQGMRFMNGKALFLGTSLIASCLGIAGCETTPDAGTNALRTVYVSTIPTCREGKECEAKWAAARDWMLDRCGFRLQHIEADYMETYKSGDYANTGLYCRVTRTPISETEYRIELKATANNPLMHSDADLLRIHQHFNDRVSGSWTPSRTSPTIR